jgi:uncharacterized membrane protein YphA (DoxX/SURF4 family)
VNILLSNRWLSLTTRISLGALFIYASLPKIGDPPAFAQILWNYKLLSGFLINPLALVLPWLEFVAGAALIAGVLRKGASLLIAAMLLVFIAALSIDLMRGIAVDCGCFSVDVVERTYQERIRLMKIDIVRDLGMLLLALQVLFARRAAMDDAGSVQGRTDGAGRSPV